MNGIGSLYVHIPFCERKCEYCDFTSIAGRRDEAAYMDALCTEIAMLGERFPGTTLHTVFVGGGTPSFVDPERLAVLLAVVRSRFHVAAGAEITMEANPSSTDPARARAWRAAGFSRISLGIQSCDDAALRFLGRVHDAATALRAIDAVRSAGFVSVNCDLIYAVPGLDDAAWLATLRNVLAHEPQHVSCYELTVEEGTPLHRSVRLGRVRTSDAETALRQHHIARDTLRDAGLEQYEVSNFARPGHESRHNLAYWRNAFYLAAGVGAHGHVPAAGAARIGVAADADAVAVRYWHGRGIGSYVERVRSGELPIAGAERVDAATATLERLMLGLRLRDGVVLEPPALLRAEALRRTGLVTLTDGRVRVTDRGEEVLNAVAAELAAA